VIRPRDFRYTSSSFSKQSTIFFFGDDEQLNYEKDWNLNHLDDKTDDTVNNSNRRVQMLRRFYIMRWDSYRHDVTATIEQVKI
jgi:hypothetical protein